MASYAWSGAAATVGRSSWGFPEYSSWGIGRGQAADWRGIGGRHRLRDDGDYGAAAGARSHGQGGRLDVADEHAPGVFQIVEIRHGKEHLSQDSLGAFSRGMFPDR